MYTPPSPARTPVLDVMKFRNLIKDDSVMGIIDM